MRMTMFPFSLMSYLLGVTSVTFYNYFMGTLSVCLHVVLWLYIGSTLTMFDDDSPKQKKASMVEKTVLVGQVVLAICLGLYIGRVAKREFERGLRMTQELHQQQDDDPERIPLKK